MGYETRLIIGRSCHTSDEIERGDLVIEDGETCRPWLKDGKGEFIKTGRKATYFMVYAEIDLCKCGYLSEINKLDRINKDESHFWEWYGSGDGNKEITEDAYGEKPKPLPLSVVVDALEKDAKDNDYRRFKWALGLLKSMQDDAEENLSVLLYGH
jgi:hypothetical protein